MTISASSVPDISQEKLESGLSALVRDGVYAQIVGALTSGVLLVGFAMELGASNLSIGLLASLPFLAQVCQLPAIALVERLRARRMISVLALSASRFLLIPIAFLPLLGPGTLSLTLLIGGIAVSAGLGSIASCSWNSWIRDFVPERMLGGFFGRRLFFATFFAMMFGLAGGFFVDHWGAAHPDARGNAYTILFIGGAIAGALSTWYLAKVPEPQMAPRTQHVPLLKMIREPLADRNFRRLIVFLGSWHFAVNVASPFFVVYLMSQLKYDISVVTTLTVVSQLANVLMLRQWGRLADRLTNKAVLAVCAPVFLTCILAWPFMAMPEPHRWTLPLLVMLHAVMGAAQAGVNLTTCNIGLKLAPHGRATAYLAATSLVTAFAAGIAPIIGGLFADDFATRELSFLFRWESAGDAAEFIAVKLKHWDFFFMFSFALGLFALNRLGKVKENGEVTEQVVVRHLMSDARRSIINLSSAGGFHALALLRSATALRRTRRPVGQHNARTQTSTAPGTAGARPATVLTNIAADASVAVAVMQADETSATG